LPFGEGGQHPEWGVSFTGINKERSVQGYIPIGIIDYNYNYLDSTALKTNVLQIQKNQLYTTSSETQLFVKQAEAFVTSILSDGIITGNNSFVFDSAFIFTNTKQKIDHLVLDFGISNGSFSIKPGERKSFVVSSGGKTKIKYSLFLTNGKSLTGYSTLIIASSAPSSSIIQTAASDFNWCDSIRLTSDETYLDYQGINAPGIADMLLYYSDCTNKTLKRPIIICDGFDPGDTRQGRAIYQLINQSPYTLAYQMRSKGYDVIIVNFPNGADYIVRNAYALEKVIKWANQNKTTSNKLVIVGPSMGGLITRYALAKMEKDGVDHKTGLWISFDAPHQGANISIGDQYFLDFFGRAVNNANANAGLAKVNSPAAKQMLVDHYTKQWEYYWDYAVPASSSYRATFLNELLSNGVAGSNGYPKNLRKIALLNGSGTGTTQVGIDNYPYLFTMNHYILILQVAHAEVSTAADLTYLNKSVLYAWCASPNVWTQRWSQPSNLSYFTTDYDKAPGGTHATQTIIANGNSDFAVNYPTHCFIPSVSALDLSTPYLTLNISTANILANHLTPFDNYYAPPDNQDHISFSAPSASWISNELGINLTLTGPTLVCSNSTFTVNNLPAAPDPYTVTWTYSSTLRLVSSTTNSITLAPNGNGNGWVQPTVVAAFGSTTLPQNNVWVGVPLTPSSINGFCCNGMGFKSNSGYTFSVDNVNVSVNQYNWIVNGGTIVRGQGTKSIDVLTANAPPAGIPFDVSVRIGNNCGWTSYLQRSGFTAPFIGNSMFSIYPNPASSEVTISVSDLASISDTISTSDVISITNIEIIDLFGNIKKIQKTGPNQKSVTINISDIQKGTYVIIINYGLKQESHILTFE